MDAFVAGNLGGRLVLSYLMVWLSMLMFCHDWQIAFKHTHSPGGLGLVLLMLCMGLAAMN
jgi:hypothetical protein